MKIDVDRAISNWLGRSKPAWLTLWATTFAFMTYFCMYAFRKPIAVATFEGAAFFGTRIELKTAIVLSQVVGYTISKFVGIRLCSETSREHRSGWIIGLILASELALVVFGLFPDSLRVIPIFFNGLCLGMIWGLVVSYLEGRRSSEILLAGLSCSYIVSSGLVKDAGRWVLSLGIPESWMLAVTGIGFLPILFLSVYLLDRIPEPNSLDIQQRSRRTRMGSEERWRFLRRFAPGMALLTVTYFFVTAWRDYRDINGQEIFDELGYGETPGIFSLTELPIAFGVMVVLSLIGLVSRPRLGLMAVFAALAFGVAMMGIATVLYQSGRMDGVVWMILTGLGAYIAYVPFGSVLFERIMAATRFPGTAVFAIYVVDSVGYSGSVGLLLYKDFFAAEATRLHFLIQFTRFLALFGMLTFALSAVYFYRQTARKVNNAESLPQTLSGG